MPNVADKYAFDLIKNLGLGCNFWPCTCTPWYNSPQCTFGPAHSCNLKNWKIMYQNYIYDIILLLLLIKLYLYSRVLNCSTGPNQPKSQILFDKKEPTGELYKKNFGAVHRRVKKKLLLGRTKQIPGTLFDCFVSSQLQQQLLAVS